jgi:hypothetical protein
MLENLINSKTPIQKEEYQPDQNKTEHPRSNHSEILSTKTILSKVKILKQWPILMPLRRLRHHPFLLLLLIWSINHMKIFEKSTLDTKAVQPLKGNMKAVMETEIPKTDIDGMKEVEPTDLKKNFIEMKAVEVMLHEIGSSQMSQLGRLLQATEINSFSVNQLELMILTIGDLKALKKGFLFRNRKPARSWLTQPLNVNV